jgi:hypothetical protein
MTYSPGPLRAISNFYENLRGGQKRLSTGVTFRFRQADFVASVAETGDKLVARSLLPGIIFRQ